MRTQNPCCTRTLGRTLLLVESSIVCYHSERPRLGGSANGTRNRRFVRRNSSYRLLDHRKRHATAGLGRDAWCSRRHVHSSSPAVGTRSVQTPGNIVLLEEQAQSAGLHQACRDARRLLASEQIMTAGNVVFGGLIGLGVDAASAQQISTGCEIIIEPHPKLRRSKEGPRVPMAITPCFTARQGSPRGSRP